MAAAGWASIRTCGRVIWRALVIYDHTDGEQRAASFAYYAFFALFPLILIFVSFGSLFIDQANAATSIINFIDPYVNVSPGEQNVVVETVRGVVKSRGGVSLLAALALLWSALRFFQALVRGVNRAWGTKEYSWWRLPFKNLAIMGIVASTLLLGIIAPSVMDAIEAFWWSHPLVGRFGVMARVFQIVRWLLPSLILFYGFTMFYKFAPRRKTSFGEIWIAALFVTVFLQVLQSLFVFYARHWGNFNAVYGTFAGVIVLLMWIYLSGSIIILGGCFSAAQAEVTGRKTS
jgi:YihY family inner membrane protein